MTNKNKTAIKAFVTAGVLIACGFGFDWAGGLLAEATGTPPRANLRLIE